MTFLRRTAVFLASAALLSPVAGATAQTSGAGVYLGGGPAGLLGSLGRNLGATAGESTESEMSTGFVVAGGLAAGLPLPRLSVRGDLRYAPDADVTVERFACAAPADGGQSPSCRARSGGSYLSAGADLVYTTRGLRGGPRGFVALGAGLKRYDFSERPTVESVAGRELYAGSCRPDDLPCRVLVEGYAEGRAHLAGRIGVGLTIDVGALRMFGEMSDHVSTFREGVGGTERLQHDLALVVGTGFSL